MVIFLIHLTAILVPPCLITASPATKLSNAPFVSRDTSSAVAYALLATTNAKTALRLHFVVKLLTDTSCKAESIVLIAD
jgi:hypothetical protein